MLTLQIYFAQGRARPKFAVARLKLCVRLQSTRDWRLTLASAKSDIYVKSNQTKRANVTHLFD